MIKLNKRDSTICSLILGYNKTEKKQRMLIKRQSKENILSIEYNHFLINKVSMSSENQNLDLPLQIR